MPIRSMTGFAREAGTTGPHGWAWELKTVNGRGIDIRVRTPPGLDAVGEEARRLVASALARGQCQLTLVVDRAAAQSKVRINRQVLDGLIAGLATLDRPGDLGPATLDGLLAARGVVEVEEDGAGAGPDELRAPLLAATGRLVAALERARAAEGEALAAVIAAQVDRMEDLVESAEAAPGRRPAAVQARLALTIAALLGASPALDPNRLHQEAVLAAGRADIREELDRLRAHIGSARELLGGSGAVGRRLDFLAQELGREANTLCAKANDVELSRIGLELKTVVEQFREQVQNVE